MRQLTCIIYIRLSRDSDESTSVKSQTAACEEYAERNGWRVLFVAEDVDVSGASRLEDREAMGKVLAALDKADYVLAAKLDRYARSVLEFSRLLKATEDNSATLITADGTLTPTTSKLVVHVLSAFAEFERDQIKTRILTSKEQLRTEGRWLGGLAPYGYRIVKRDGGKYLEIDKDAAKVLRDIADKLMNKGKSLTSIMHDLNTRGVLSPADHARKRDGRKVRGTKWSTTTLRDVLITPAVRGYLCQAPAGKPRCAENLVPVLNTKGEPVQVGPELFDAATHDTIKAKLKTRSVGKGAQRSGKALLLHVAECSDCSGPMYHQKRVVKGTDYSTYLCQNGVGKKSAHPSNIVKASGINETVEAEFLKRFGFFGWLREVVHEGRDVAREIRETETSIDNLSGNLESLPAGGRSAKRITGQIGELEEKLAALEKEAEKHTDGPATEWVKTGRTVAQEWTERDTDGRRSMLRDFGAVATVTPLPKTAERRYSDARVDVVFLGPEWYRDNPAAGELAAIEAVELVA
ncbi:recombinase family protein [Streptomyces sp. NPDC091267]|uniref:recombinase family protein n=1 Tax=Streptomyces sp. NPDC091267 TaxID=3155195 RepID=UPI00343CF3F5